MERDNPILDRVGSVIKRLFRCPDARILPTTVSSDIDGWDSVAHVMVILECEREFGIRFPQDRIYSMSDVGEMCQIISSELGAKDAIHPPVTDSGKREP